MEANREAAMQCLSIATSAWALDDITKALKFAQKSHDLFPGTASDAIIRNAKLCEANRHAAEQSLVVATRFRNDGDIERALKYAKKSRYLCPSVIATTMMLQLDGLQKERLADLQKHLRVRESSHKLQKSSEEFREMADRHQRKWDELQRKQRHRHILRVTFRAWVKVKRDGIETPPEGAAPVDPVELQQLYSELDVLSISTSPKPNKELDLAMGLSSPTCVICEPAEGDLHSMAGSVITRSDVAQSVATSAITLESTLHLRQRKGERGISRRELQSALKHGEADRDPLTGRVIHRHNGLTFVTDAGSKVGITAWSEDTCKERGCNGEAECFRGFCGKCCWGCDEHERCKAAGCTREDVCIRGFCRSCCYGSSRCDCVPGW
jgi:hypothetical protein